LLHDIFDFSHADIAALIHKSEPACRQLLQRAKESVTAERPALEPSRDEHRRLLQAFLGAVQAGDVDHLTRLLADDAVLIADGGPDGVRFGGIRNLPRPLAGVVKIRAFLIQASKQGAIDEMRECELNGQPAIIAMREGQAVAAILLSVVDGKIRNVFIHADPARLGHVGLPN
jgi:RNA polymerase sigma-70 factor (ECF subfamily)